MATSFDWAMLLLILGVACWRLAHLTAVDGGPFWMFKRMRDAVAARWGANSWQADGARCVFCHSVWFAAILCVLIFRDESISAMLVSWMAVAGVASFLHVLAYK